MFEGLPFDSMCFTVHSLSFGALVDSSNLRWIVLFDESLRLTEKFFLGQSHPVKRSSE